MASLIGKSGKCSNFGNCSMADARSTVEVATGMDFVCTECRKPLLMSDSAVPAGGSKTMMLGVIAVVVLLLGGAAVWFLKGDKTPDKPHAEAAPVSQAQPAPTPVKPAANGHCSAADEQAGLCKTTR